MMMMFLFLNFAKASDVIGTSVGSYHSCALKKDRAICWGLQGVTRIIKNLLFHISKGFNIPFTCINFVLGTVAKLCVTVLSPVASLGWVGGRKGTWP